MAGYRRAIAAQTANLAKLTRKHRELSGISEFYRCLYSDWDVFMTQFYDPEHQLLDVGSKRLSNAHHAAWWIQRRNRRSESTSGHQQCTRATDTTNTDKVVARPKRRAKVSDQPTIDVKGVSEISATDTNTVTIRAMSEAPELSPVLDEQTSDAERTSEMSAAEDVTMTTNRRSSRLRSAIPVAGAQLLMDSDVKPALDEPVERTLHSGRKKPAVHESGCMEPVNEDVKPFAGLPVKIRRIGRAKLDRSTGSSSSATLCDRRRRGKRDVSEASVDTDVVTVKKRRARPGKCVVSRVVDNNENDEIKPVVRSVERRGRKTKQSRLNADAKTTGAENAVEVLGEIACIKSEEQDVKPDLSSLNVTVTSADPAVKPRTAKRRRGFSRKFDVSNKGKNTQRASGTMERNRKRRKRRQSTKNSVEVDTETLRTGFEKEDVKPDLASLEVAAVVKRGRRSKPRWPGSPVVVTRSMYRVKQLPTAAAAAAAADVHAADSKCASPARFTKSPPFTLLPPSQIKREVES